MAFLIDSKCDVKLEHSLLELRETTKEIPDVSFDPLMEAIERALSLTKAQEILAEDIERGLSVSHEIPQLVPSSDREEIICVTVNLPWVIKIAGSWSHWKPQLCQVGIVSVLVIYILIYVAMKSSKICEYIFN